MIPFRFGPSGRQLYGVFHAASTARLSRLGVLLCNPFGQENIRTHRLYRVLAERLAQVGIPVLRFDFYGTGDSAGDDFDGDLRGWCDDTVLANNELVRRGRCERLVWIGARLGGTIGAFAAGTARPSPVGLVLWEPIVDGGGYMRSLAERQGMPVVASAAARQTGEAMGFGLGANLIDELSQLRLSSFERVTSGRVKIVAASGSSNEAALDAALRARGIRSDSLPLDHSFDWTSDEAMNTSLAPPPAIQLLVSLVEELER